MEWQKTVTKAAVVPKVSPDSGVYGFHFLLEQLFLAMSQIPFACLECVVKIKISVYKFSLENLHFFLFLNLSFTSIFITSDVIALQFHPLTLGKRTVDLGNSMPLRVLVCLLTPVENPLP